MSATPRMACNAVTTEAIDQLDEVQREALLLHEFLGLKVAEVASHLERSEHAVVGLLFRAKRKLAELLKGG